MVDLELYRIFTIVANEKNITKASEKLNISQPAVTKHIKNLENALELRLFNRTNHGIELTSDGQKIYEEAKEAVETLNSIFIKYGKNRNINLGVHVSMYKMFSKILTKFSNINENITINISDTDLINMLAPDLSDMIAKLENEKLDIIISKKTDNYNHNKIEFIKVGEIQDILVVNNDLPNISFVAGAFDSWALDDFKDDLPEGTSVAKPLYALAALGNWDFDFGSV